MLAVLVEALGLLDLEAVDDVAVIPNAVTVDLNNPLVFLNVDGGRRIADAVGDSPLFPFLGPHTLEIDVGDGDISYTEAREFEYERNRGRLQDVRKGDEQPVQVQFQFTWEAIRSITGADTPTIEEFLKRTGPAAAYVSSDDDECAEYAVDLEVTHTPNCSTGQKERVLLPDFRYEQLEHSYQDAVVQCSGQCNVVEATVTRIEQ